MESKPIEELKANPKNPRTISRHDATSLANGMREFGDLSPIVFNVQTGQLVGGHQRIQVLKSLLEGQKQTVITQRFEQPDSVGTVALGYVIYENRQFAYREVSWPLNRELAANVLANRAQGEFDLEQLAEVNMLIAESENGADLLMYTGQTQEEIDKLNNMVGLNGEGDDQTPPDEPEESEFKFAVTREQREIIEEAIGNIKTRRGIEAESQRATNGMALYYMSREYLDRLHGLVNDEPVA